MLSSWSVIFGWTCCSLVVLFLIGGFRLIQRKWRQSPIGSNRRQYLTFGISWGWRVLLRGKLFVLKACREGILREFHSSKFSIHQGITKMYVNSKVSTGGLEWRLMLQSLLLDAWLSSGSRLSIRDQQENSDHILYLSGVGGGDYGLH